MNTVLKCHKCGQYQSSDIYLALMRENSEAYVRGKRDGMISVSKEYERGFQNGKSNEREEIVYILKNDPDNVGCWHDCCRSNINHLATAILTHGDKDDS